MNSLKTDEYDMTGADVKIQKNHHPTPPPKKTNKKIKQTKYRTNKLLTEHPSTFSSRKAKFLRVSSSGLSSFFSSLGPSKMAETNSKR